MALIRHFPFFFWVVFRALFDGKRVHHNVYSFTCAAPSVDWLCCPSGYRFKMMRPRTKAASLFACPAKLAGILKIIFQAHFFTLRDIHSSPFLSLRIPVTSRKWQNLNVLSEPHPPPPVLQYLHFTHCSVFIVRSNPVCIRSPRNTVASEKRVPG